MHAPGLPPGTVGHQHGFPHLHAVAVDGADLQIGCHGVGPRVIPLLQSLFQNRRKRHRINMAFKGTSRNPGEFIDVGKEAVQPPGIMKTDVERPPIFPVNLKSALNKDFRHRRVAPHRRHRKHPGAPRSHGFKIKDGLRFGFRIVLCRFRRGLLCCLIPMGYGRHRRLFRTATHHLPDKPRPHDGDRRKRRTDTDDILHNHSSSSAVLEKAHIPFQTIVFGFPLYGGPKFTSSDISLRGFSYKRLIRFLLRQGAVFPLLQSSPLYKNIPSSGVTLCLPSQAVLN